MESGDSPFGDIVPAPDASPPEVTWIPGRPCPPESPLTYTNFGGPFVATHCTGCHGAAVPEGMRQDAPVDVHFDDLASIRTQAIDIYTRAADSNLRMPPSGGPNPNERVLLGDWLACGAP